MLIQIIVAEKSKCKEDGRDGYYVASTTKNCKEKAPYKEKAKKLMDEYKNLRAYNNQQEAQRCPATLEKSNLKSDMQAGGPEVPDGSDKSESESDLDTGGLEASGGSDKYKLESLQGGGPKAPDSSDKSKLESDLKAGDSEVPDKSKPESYLRAVGPEAPDDSHKSKPESVRPLHPKEETVLGGNGGKPRRQHGGLPRKLFGVARKMRKMVGCSVPLSS